jgi:hypothetical protein
MDPVVRRLDAIIGLLVRSTTQPGVDEEPSLTDRIRALNAVGLSGPEISRIVGTSTDYVGVVQRRRKRPSKGTKRRT